MNHQTLLLLIRAILDETQRGLGRPACGLGCQRRACRNHGPCCPVRGELRLRRCSRRSGPALHGGDGQGSGGRARLARRGGGQALRQVRGYRLRATRKPKTVVRVSGP